MYDAAVDSLVWYAAGPHDIHPAKVTANDGDGVLDLEVYEGAQAHTENPLIMDPDAFEPTFGPPVIVLDAYEEEPGATVQEGVAYDPNGTSGTWHEP